MRWAVTEHLRSVQMISQALLSYRDTVVRELTVPEGEPRTRPPRAGVTA